MDSAVWWKKRARRWRANTSPMPAVRTYEAEKLHFGYRKFYIAAIFFTIMHVAVLTIATVPGGASAYRALIYLVAIAASISFVFVDFD